MNILIVDDHATNRKLLRVQLESAGMRVAEAGDGREALQVMNREPVDAVISDILMPRMDGYQLCHEIRKHPEWRTLKVLLYSSTYTSPTDVKLSDTVGADQFIAKPAPVAVILGALEVHAGEESRRGSNLASDAIVLKEYSAVLVDKLEEKNSELQASLRDLQRAHARILELNATLERRVTERTAELRERNRELEAALADVKELSGLLPICTYCKKVRDDENYWEHVDAYIARRTHTKFSHGVCPECFAKANAEIDRLLPR
jgi:CheY-like chemotaxis protein